VSTGCVIGRELARGSASADDTKVTDTDPSPNSTKPLLSLSADDPTRAVSQSTSLTRLVPIPGRPGRFGAVVETRQTIAPITFGLPGTDEKFTIEVGGEWVMRATSDGTKGAVTFGAGQGREGDRALIRLIQGNTVLDEVGINDAAGGSRSGIFVNGDPIGDIRIGGASRAILGQPESRPTELPTRVMAAADIVVVRLFEPQAELRIGHMEVGLAVPAGGVPCPGIQMTKTSDPASVRPGDPFSWDIDVANPNDCTLEKVKVTDTPTASGGVIWKALSSLPRALQQPDGSLVFDEFGPLETGQTKTLKINAVVDSGSILGSITNRASASGDCGGAALDGTAETTTAVGSAVIPAAPRPPARFSGGERNERFSQNSPPPAASDDQSEEASGPSMKPAYDSSVSLKRSASAAVKGSRSSAAAPARTAAAGTTSPLPKSGADSLPYVGLAFGFLGTGRILRRIQPRR